MNARYTTNMSEGKRSIAQRERAFTLFELLTVLAIIGIVAAILLPAIAGVRQSAKSASTLSMMNQLGTSTNAFRNDKGVSPGYFSQTLMGDISNANQGFSNMQNVMLDLAGGVSTDPSVTADGTTVLEVGPMVTNTVFVDLRLIGGGGTNAPSGTGTTSAPYFTPDGSFMQAQTTAGQQVAAVANTKLPSLIDAFGNPMLAWVQDDRAPIQFVYTDSSKPSRFYWNPNSCFLSSTSFGKAVKNQSTDSLLGSGVVSTTREISMNGLLGNPAYPVINSDPPTPDAARGQVVYHSAGPNGIFLGKDERGGHLANSAKKANPKFTAGAVNYTGSSDPVKADFDDLIVTAGN